MARRNAISAKEAATNVKLLDEYDAPVMFVYDNLFDGTGEHTAFVARILYKRGWRLAGFTSVATGLQGLGTTYLYSIFERAEPVKRKSIAEKLKDAAE